MCVKEKLFHINMQFLTGALLHSCLECGCLGDLYQVGPDSQSAPSCQGHNGRLDNEKERMTVCLSETHWQKEHFMVWRFACNPT